MRAASIWAHLTSSLVLEQVFFIRDGIQFVDLVHSLRPNPKTNIQEGWRILDFLSHHPESVHIVRLSLSQLVHRPMLLLFVCLCKGHHAVVHCCCQIL